MFAEITSMKYTCLLSVSNPLPSSTVPSFSPQILAFFFMNHIFHLACSLLDTHTDKIASPSSPPPYSLSTPSPRAESLRCGVEGESSHGDGRIKHREPDGDLTNQIGGWSAGSTWMVLLWLDQSNRWTVCGGRTDGAACLNQSTEGVVWSPWYWCGWTNQIGGRFAGGTWVVLLAWTPSRSRAGRALMGQG